MNVLILEHHVPTAELLETVVTGLAPGIRVHRCSTIAEAVRAWHRYSPSLLLSEWSLPDGSALALVRQIRAQDKQLPILMLSAHSDKETVLTAARLGINAFIAKPFDVALLHRRLQPLLRTDADPGRPGPPPLDRHLAEAATGSIQLPTDIDQQTVLALMERGQELSPAELARHWRGQAALSARLLDIANSASLGRAGKPIGKLEEAIAAMGVEMALNQAFALSLDISRALADPRLGERARHHLQQAEQVAAIARAMALSLGQEGAAFYTAGLLSRVGELGVLRALQDYIRLGGAISAQQIDDSLSRWAADYGNRVKIQWHLPLPLRELIGAVHLLKKNSADRGPLLMYLAAMTVAGQLEQPDILRLMRRVGLDPERWQRPAPRP
ncbi:HDOD domain-containing protein [Zobellella iuensis]|uniref:HDOD domain-containing protein n=1 Tax=Zobellella iuensis TaxID=2803811 RepID=A0ABS1QN94_9GAMM|nr:HDOD domain-containing protein [Zobellella iuensis]MBL1375764.1 HDOD domain-containing protein [Zobellella iuensis]